MKDKDRKTLNLNFMIIVLMMIGGIGNLGLSSDFIGYTDEQHTTFLNLINNYGAVFVVGYLSILILMIVIIVKLFRKLLS